MNYLEQLKKVMKQSAKKQQMFVVKPATTDYLKVVAEIMETDFCKICPERLNDRGHCYDVMRTACAALPSESPNDKHFQDFVKRKKCKYNTERLIYGTKNR